MQKKDSNIKEVLYMSHRHRELFLYGVHKEQDHIVYFHKHTVKY